MDANDELNSRQTKDAPWCWQHKHMLQLITDAFGESDQAASARSLYVALTELASDAGSETFTASKVWIAHKAGLSVSTVQRLLNGFEYLGVVHIKRNLIDGAFKAANTYTLPTTGNGDATISHGRYKALNPDKVKEKERNSEEKEKEQKERVANADKSDATEIAEEAYASATRAFSPKYPYPETEDECYETLERLGIDIEPDYDGNFFYQMAASGWTIRGEPVWDWPAVYAARLLKTMP